MAKEDAPAPARPPVKRRALERAPDHWLAIWASDEALSDADRERVEEVRDHRRQARKTTSLKLGLLPDAQGVTPRQLTRLVELLLKHRPSEVHHPWTTKPVASACRSLQVPVFVYKDVRDANAPLREVVLASQMVIAAPRGQEQKHNRTPAWEAAHYAKHRKLTVIVVLPDGTTKGEEG